MQSDNKNSVLIKANSYRYPTKAERAYANKLFPKFKSFGFERRSVFVSFVIDKINPVQAVANENLYYWDLVLVNRLGSLYLAFYNSITNFRRGIPDDYTKISDKDGANLLLFHFYSEAYYHVFFSVKEIVYQILGLLYNCNVKEDDPNLIRKVEALIGNSMEAIDKEFYKELLNFKNVSKETIQIRNGFTHRYSPNLPDFRSRIDIDKNNLIYAGSGKHYRPSQIYENIIESTGQLYDFIEVVRKRIEASKANK